MLLALHKPPGFVAAFRSKLVAEQKCFHFATFARFSSATSALTLLPFAFAFLSVIPERESAVAIATKTLQT